MISAAFKRPALRGGSRAVSSVAAEFAAASNNMKQSLSTELESIFDDVQADVGSSGAAEQGSAASAIGVPVAEEPLKPHHEGFFEARNQTEGTAVVEQESYSGAKLQNHFTRDVNAFLANPPVPGGSFDVAAAAEKHGIDAASALKAVGIDSKALAQATPRLMADLYRYQQGDPLTQPSQLKTLAPALQDKLSQGSFWAGMLSDKASVDAFAAEVARSGADADGQQLNIDLTTLLDDFHAEGLSSGVQSSARSLMGAMLQEISKLDEASQRVLAQTDFPAADNDWRVPTAEQIADSDAAAASDSGPSTDGSAAAAGADAAAAGDGKASRRRVDVALLDSAEDPAAALYAEELRDGRDSDLFPRDPNFRAPIAEADDSEYMSDVDDQEDNWVKFRSHKTEALTKALESGSDGASADDDSILDPSMLLPGGEQGALAEAAEPPLPEVMGHSRSYKTHHFRMLEAMRHKDLTQVFSEWTLNAQRSNAPDYIATHIMLDAAASAGAAEVFAYVMDDLLARHGQMTHETYKVALKAAGVLGNLDAAEMAFKQLATQEGYTPDIHAYAPVIAAAVRSGEMHTAFKWFNRMRHQGLRPSDTVFGLLVSGACAAPTPAPLAVLWTAMKLHQVVPVSRDTWHALLDGFTAQAAPDAEAIWEAYSCMAHPRWFGGPVTPDAQRMCDVFNALVAAHMYDEARRLQQHMADAGMFASKAISAQEIRDVVAGFPAAGTYATGGAAQWMAQPNQYGQPYLPEDAAAAEELLAAAEEQMASAGSIARLQGADVKDYPWDRAAAAEAEAEGR